jgi:hypothetical protein
MASERPHSRVRDNGLPPARMHSIHERIVVRGPEFVSARLTPEAYSLGLAIALPERVQPAKRWVPARPTGLEQGMPPSSSRSRSRPDRRDRPPRACGSVVLPEVARWCSTLRGERADRDGR